MGIVLYYQGQFDGALQHLVVQKSLLASASEAAKLDWRTETAGPAFLALTLACLGYPDRAASQLSEAMELASRKGSYALAYSLSVAIRVLILLRDDTRLRECAARLIALSDEGGFRQFLNQGLCALGWLEARTGVAEHLGLEPKQFRFVPPFTLGRCCFERGVVKDERAVDVARCRLG